MLTIISPNERIAVSVRDDAVHVLFGLLQSNVHVSIEARKNAYKKSTLLL